MTSINKINKIAGKIDLPPPMSYLNPKVASLFGHSTSFYHFHSQYLEETGCEWIYYYDFTTKADPCVRRLPVAIAMVLISSTTKTKGWVGMMSRGFAQKIPRDGGEVFTHFDDFCVETMAGKSILQECVFGGNNLFFFY